MSERLLANLSDIKCDFKSLTSYYILDVSLSSCREISYLWARELGSVEIDLRIIPFQPVDCKL